MKKPYTTFPFFQAAGLFTVVAVTILVVLEWGFGLSVFVPGVLLILLAFLILTFRIAQLLYKHALDRVHDTNQMESTLWLYAQFTPSVALPALRDVAGSPDFLKAIVEAYYKYQPKVIVELGSGVSSIILSELLKKEKSDTKHYALDHLEKYAQLTAEKVTNPNSEVLVAPLRSYTIDGKSWQCYDMSVLEEVDQIDMLIIDGPPENIQRMARYPAYPLLEKKMSERAVIVLDDTNRKDEQAIIKAWAEEFNLEARSFFTEKGTYLMGKNL